MTARGWLLSSSFVWQMTAFPVSGHWPNQGLGEACQHCRLKQAESIYYTWRRRSLVRMTVVLIREMLVRM